MKKEKVKKIAKLKRGEDFNTLLKFLIKGYSSYNHWIHDDKIEAIIFDRKFKKPASGYVELQESGSPVYAWLSKNGGTIKITSSADTIYANEDCSSMFNEFLGKKDKRFICNLFSHVNTEKVVNMRNMFRGIGHESSELILEGLSDMDVSNVTDMGEMFANAGYHSQIFHLDLSNWDVSKVTNMCCMFSSAGAYAKEWSIGNLQNWNTRNLEKANYMFALAGVSAKKFELNLSNWSMKSMKRINNMFNLVGCEAEKVKINLSNWNFERTVNMRYIFDGTGMLAKNVKIDLSHWKNVEHYVIFDYAFKNTALSVKKVEIKIPHKTAKKSNTKYRFYVSDEKYIESPRFNSDYITTERKNSTRCCFTLVD